MSCSILLNCKENLLNNLSFDVIYTKWLTSSNPSHIIKIISSSYNYSGNIKEKGNSWLVLFELYLQTDFYLGDREHFISCKMEGTVEWSDWLLTTAYWIRVLPMFRFPFCTPVVNIAGFQFPSFMILLCAIQGYPLLFASVLFLLRVKSLSCLKRGNCIHLFIKIINSALKEDALIGNFSWCGVRR